MAPKTGGQWSVISSSTLSVNADALGTWDATGVGGGEYLLRLTANDSNAQTAQDIVAVHVDGEFDAVRTYEPSQGGVYSGVIPIIGTVTDRNFQQYTVDYGAVGDPSFLPVEPGMSVYLSSVELGLLALWSTESEGVPDGPYELMITGEDACASTRSLSRSIIVDNMAPGVGIENVMDCECYESLDPIFGTVEDDYLAHWTLELAGAGQVWTELAKGEDPVSSDFLAEFNAEAMTPCLYALRLVATDSAVSETGQPNRSEHVVVFEIGCSGHDFDADNDGDIDMEDFREFQVEYTGP